MAYSVVVRLEDARVIEAISASEVKRGDPVVVNVDGVLEYGATMRVAPVFATDPAQINTIIRVATEADVIQDKKNRELAQQDQATVLDFVTKHELSLKLVAVLRSFDNKKLLIMYTASERVDFRALVRELAVFFRMRIEMRQIGEREEACFLGGCGVCGQPICCRRFLTQPKQTSIKMAKLQNSALTPNKVNGLCGKLMCCLQYEYGQYQEILAKMPGIGAEVDTPGGAGVVEYNDCLRELVAVRLNDQKGVQKFALDKITVTKPAKEHSSDE